MSSLGYQLVYSLLNERDDIVCERFFFPDSDGEFLSYESGRNLQDFPLLFFSISFEQDYINIVKLLKLGGIRCFTSDRSMESDAPLVIGGGVAAFMNPEPIAPFFDCMVIGEAEPVLNILVDCFVSGFGGKRRKDLLLDIVHSGDGFYVPEFYRPHYDSANLFSHYEITEKVPERVKRVVLPDCDKAAHSELLTPAAEFSDIYLTELGRGCSRGCRFCAAGFIYRPPRLWDADSVIHALNEKGKDVNRIGLLGMEMAGQGVMDSISSYLLDSGCALSFSSLRADKINDKLLTLLSESSLKSVAIAPDGTSERLRKVINKGLDEKDLTAAAVRLTEAGVYKIKLYVMVGLPTETRDDLQEFIDLLHTIKSKIDRIGRKRGRLTELFLSVNCFVPKPWTPFQFHSFGCSERLAAGEKRKYTEILAALRKKISFLKKECNTISNTYFQADKPENALFQAVLSRGDRRLAKVLEGAAANRFSWKNGIKKNDITIEQYISTGTNEDSNFPWYILDHTIRHEYLWEEYLKSFEEKMTAPCDIEICRRCGVCSEK